jgi:hypothetical protein
VSRRDHPQSSHARRAADLRSAVLTARDLDACRRLAVAAIDELAEAIVAEPVTRPAHPRADGEGAVPRVLPNGVTLTPSQHAVLQALFDHPRGIAAQPLCEIVYGGHEQDWPKTKVIEVHLTHLTKKLVKAGLSTSGSRRSAQGPIHVAWGFSEWTLSAEVRRAIEALVAGEDRP